MQNEMRILGPEGDTKVIWDPENDEEVKSARKRFDELVKKGFHAFQVKKSGKAGKRMTEFDPDAGKVILVPRLIGG